MWLLDNSSLSICNSSSSVSSITGMSTSDAESQSKFSLYQWRSTQLYKWLLSFSHKMLFRNVTFLNQLALIRTIIGIFATIKLIFFSFGVNVLYVWSYNEDKWHFFCAVYLSPLLEKYSQTNSFSEIPQFFFSDFLFCNPVVQVI